MKDLNCLRKYAENTGRLTEHHVHLHCVQKKHPLTVSFIYPRMMCRFKQKLQRIYPRNGIFW